MDIKRFLVSLSVLTILVGWGCRDDEGRAATEPGQSQQGDSETVAAIGPIGFGNKASGGAGGAVVTATSADSLQKYAAMEGPYIIQVSGNIDLKSLKDGNLVVASDKTITGVGTRPRIEGTIRIRGVRNVIVQNLFITSPHDDGVQIADKATDVWVDHCTFIDCADGSVDISQGADNVTVSWCKFEYLTNREHPFANLIGGGDKSWGDRGKLHVTMHHNWYSAGCQERMPSVRFGRVHIFNNYYNSPGNNSGVNYRIESEVILQNSYFENIKRPWISIRLNGTKYGKFSRSGNVLVNCTGVDESMGKDTVFDPPYAYNLQTAEDAKNSVMTGAGCKL
jgi:pectate lyase